MSQLSSDNADILVRLRLKGFLRPSLGEESAFAALVTNGAAEAVKFGHRLTSAGRLAADAVWASDRAAADAAALSNLYACFETINAPFKALVADWQLRDGQPNDHLDGSYDTAVLARLDPLADTLVDLLADLTQQVPRMARYAQAFAAARVQLRSGQTRWFAAPMIDSVHTLWFELHEELIHLTGRTRAGEAAAGRGA